MVDFEKAGAPPTFDRHAQGVARLGAGGVANLAFAGAAAEVTLRGHGGSWVYFLAVISPAAWAQPMKSSWVAFPPKVTLPSFTIS